MALSDDHKVKSQDGFAHSEMKLKGERFLGRWVYFLCLSLLIFINSLKMENYLLLKDYEYFFALFILVFLVVIFSKNLKKPAR